jgi:hypothetical protein
MASSRLIHVVKNDSISFFSKVEYILSLYAVFSLSIYPLTYTKLAPYLDHCELIDFYTCDCPVVPALFVENSVSALLCYFCFLVKEPRWLTPIIPATQEVEIRKKISGTPISAQ